MGIFSRETMDTVGLKIKLCNNIKKLTESAYGIVEMTKSEREALESFLRGEENKKNN